jgi:hypothetical protein
MKPAPSVTGTHCRGAPYCTIPLVTRRPGGPRVQVAAPARSPYPRSDLITTTIVRPGAGWLRGARGFLGAGRVLLTMRGAMLGLGEGGKRHSEYEGV